MVFGFLRKKEQKPVAPITNQYDYRAKIQEISIKMRILSEKLEQNEARLQEKSKRLFDKVVRAEALKDREKAAIYADEIVQVRKVAKTVWIGVAALEKVTMRLDTVRSAMEVKDLLTSPELGVLKPLSETLRGVMPEVSLELGKLNEGMEEIAMSFGTMGDQAYIPEESDEEVQAILRQASEVASQRMKSAFPDLPNPMSEKESSYRF